MSLSYVERQAKWVEKHDVEVGNFVTVMQKYNSKICGTGLLGTIGLTKWINSWAECAR